MKKHLAGKASFLRCLTLCHDCTLLQLPKPDGSFKELLTGSSLDEQCLLNELTKQDCARFAFRTANSVRIRQDGREENYELLRTIEFSSERKLMSVVVRDKESSECFVFTKGADSQVL